MKRTLDLDNFLARLQLQLSSVQLGRFVRFAVVGLSGVVVDMGLFYLLHAELLMELTLSAILSTEMAIINNFIWNDIWTFSEISQQENALMQRLFRFAKFNLVSLLSLTLNPAIVYVLFHYSAVNEYLAKVVAIGCLFLLNFWLNSRVSWQIKEQLRNT